MFSTGESEYIKNLTEQFYSKDYKYYYCITNNPINLNNSNNIYDVFCYYSKEEITKSGNNIRISNGRKCSLDSNNYSANNNIDKLVCENFNGNIEENKKEFVYSNIGEYANIIREYQDNNYYITTIAMAGIIIISLIFITKFIEKLIN